ncbi:hypothetical protein AYO49_04935 [Verrucomicrobiaceae bacterium SCGC AG-212-N21]|nr:hypothetical protein AYO49_04935 [Verrucomicrobiaceae bacterium SCGC AG-212-N21]
MAVVLTVIALPFIYLLSVPPLAHFAMDEPYHPPDWLVVYAVPWEWVRDNTALRFPFLRYEEWWHVRLENRYSRRR